MRTPTTPEEAKQYSQEDYDAFRRMCLDSRLEGASALFIANVAQVYDFDDTEDHDELMILSVV